MKDPERDSGGGSGPASASDSSLRSEGQRAEARRDADTEERAVRGQETAAGTAWGGSGFRTRFLAPHGGTARTRRGAKKGDPAVICCKVSLEHRR